MEFETTIGLTEEQFESFRPLARRIMRFEDRVDEVMQQAFAAAAEAYPDRGDEDCLVWFHRIFNRVLAAQRYRVGGRTGREKKAATDAAYLSRATPELSARHLDPNWDLERLRNCRERLSLVDRVILRLKDEQYRYPEIVRHEELRYHNLSVDDARQRAYRARQKLADCLERKGA